MKLDSAVMRFAGTVVLGRPTDVSVVANVVSPTTANAYLEFGITSGTYPARTAEITLNANEPREIELETIAQTWSEHCVHKTLKSRVRYREAGLAQGSQPFSPCGPAETGQIHP